MASEKSPMVLLHGLSSSGKAWRDVVPLLAEVYDAHAPTSLGHVGGATVQKRPVTLTDVVDEAERYLDDHGLDQPHVVGHSMGGFVAIEVARRGRAASVCAITPGGFWNRDDERKTASLDEVIRGIAMGRRIRWIYPLLVKPKFLRRLVLQSGAGDGARVSEARAVEMFHDALGCTVVEDIAASSEFIAPLDPLPCPVDIVWAEKDPIIPPASYEAEARKRLPGASFHTLPGLAHEPMVDAPELVARTILAVTAPD
jgi:pimeloyl-ACP methyl ester carboxylesterase